MSHNPIVQNAWLIDFQMECNTAKEKRSIVAPFCILKHHWSTRRVADLQ